MTRFSLDFNYALGRPDTVALFRRAPEDFVVEEVFDTSLSGEGEHFWLHIKKKGENTDWVAKKLANYFSVRKMDVGYGGKKDRHAVTSQWFSVYLPGQTHRIDWSDFLDMASIDAELLEQSSHDRKLKKGHHEANIFTIRLYGLVETDQLHQRLQRVQQHGVPNYFGPQRFGRDAGNLTRAEQWVADPRSIRDRGLRGMIMSAARAYLFNQVLSSRVGDGTWMNMLEGDPASDTCATGPLWGRGRSLASALTLEQEAAVLAPYARWCDALENVGLNQERRMLGLRPQNFSYTINGDCLLLRFTLGAGQFATSILREITELEEQERIGG